VGFGIVRPSGKAEENFAEIIPRYADVAIRFEDFLSRRRFREDPVNVDSIPPCLIPRQAGFIGARMRLVSLGEAGLIERDEFWEKIKGEPCERCLCQTSCEGVWEGYVERFGWNEFAPIVEPPWTHDGAHCVHDVTSTDDNVPLVALTNRCNNGCTRFCRSQVGRAKPPGDAEARLEALARAGASRVRLGGGEPLLSPLLPELLTKSAKLGLEVTLCTNARLLSYTRLVAQLGRRAKPSLHTVLFSDTAADHDRVTRVEGSFGQSLEGLRNARGAGWSVRVVLPVASPSPVSKRLEEWGCEVLRKRLPDVDDT